MTQVRLLKAAKIFKIFEEELNINISFLKLGKLFFGVLFTCHVIGCIAYAISTSQSNHIYGMFRRQEWWGCELPPFAPSDFGVEVVSANSTFVPDVDIECEPRRLEASWSLPGAFLRSLG